jgi:hypothetical protein
MVEKQILTYCFLKKDLIFTRMTYVDWNDLMLSKLLNDFDWTLK